ncbi:MAG: carboxymuconolactone decarboxylase family protein [Dehalococcoidia bacterium]
MPTLEERMLSSYPVLARLGRADENGIPRSNNMINQVAPDLWRIIGEACFGYLWNRPGLTMEQRSLSTISIITVLRRDDNLKGHVESGLDVGLSAEQIVEIMIQLIFYTGAPIANTGLRVAHDVFRERGIQVQPQHIYDTTEDPEAMYQRGRATFREIIGERPERNRDEVNQAWERYLMEYLWGSVWTRPLLTVQERMVCVLTALTEIGTDNAFRNHVRGALNVGLTEQQINELIFHQTFYIGVPKARHAKALAKEVFDSR